MVLPPERATTPDRSRTTKTTLAIAAALGTAVPKGTWEKIVGGKLTGATG